MTLPSGDGDSRLVENAICCISFSYGASQCAFVGCIIDVRRSVPGEVRIVVRFPKLLVTTNLRQSFRVPVIGEVGT